MGEIMTLRAYAGRHAEFERARRLKGEERGDAEDRLYDGPLGLLYTQIEDLLDGGEWRTMLGIES